MYIPRDFPIHPPSYAQTSRKEKGGATFLRHELRDSAPIRPANKKMQVYGSENVTKKGKLYAPDQDGTVVSLII